MYRKLVASLLLVSLVVLVVAVAGCPKSKSIEEFQAEEGVAPFDPTAPPKPMDIAPPTPGGAAPAADGEAAPAPNGDAPATDQAAPDVPGEPEAPSGD